MGAKEIAVKAGVPVVPGYSGEDQNFDRFKYEAGEIGFPILLKASAGGGGKGMRIVNKASELKEAFEAAKREAEKSFGDGTLLMEKYFSSAKHIEFQIFGDTHGNYTHFFDRECSMQRRYQKVIEESPSPSLTPELREQMGNASVELARAVKYTSAGTVEFLFIPATENQEAAFYFLEVNARLQVEHPVTEAVTWLDLVRLQIEVAQGMPLQFTNENVQQVGHAIECRICAEDPEKFLPQAGKVTGVSFPNGVGVRVDSHLYRGYEIPVFYDSMVAKLTVWGKDRKEAISRGEAALMDTTLNGVKTNIPVHLQILKNQKFISGNYTTKLIGEDFTYEPMKPSQEDLRMALISTAVAAYSKEYRGPDRTQGAVQDASLWRNAGKEGALQ
jgi:acetyl-CoA carboxylase biotin carboxylase subunit